MSAKDPTARPGVFCFEFLYRPRIMRSCVIRAAHSGSSSFRITAQAAYHACYTLQTSHRRGSPHTWF